MKEVAIKPVFRPLFLGGKKRSCHMVRSMYSVFLVARAGQVLQEVLIFSGAVNFHLVHSKRCGMLVG